MFNKMEQHIKSFGNFVDAWPYCEGKLHRRSFGRAGYVLYTSLQGDGDNGSWALSSSQAMLRCSFLLPTQGFIRKVLLVFRHILQIGYYSSCTNFRHFRQCPQWRIYVLTNIETSDYMKTTLNLWKKILS